MVMPGKNEGLAGGQACRCGHSHAHVSRQAGRNIAAVPPAVQTAPAAVPEHSTKQYWQQYPPAGRPHEDPRSRSAHPGWRRPASCHQGATPAPAHRAAGGEGRQQGVHGVHSHQTISLLKIKHKQAEQQLVGEMCPAGRCRSLVLAGGAGTGAAAAHLVLQRLHGSLPAEHIPGAHSSAAQDISSVVQGNRSVRGQSYGNRAQAVALCSHATRSPPASRIRGLLLPTPCLAPLTCPRTPRRAAARWGRTAAR